MTHKCPICHDSFEYSKAGMPPKTCGKEACWRENTNSVKRDLRRRKRIAEEAEDAGFWEKDPESLKECIICHDWFIDRKRSAHERVTCGKPECTAANRRIKMRQNYRHHTRKPKNGNGLHFHLDTEGPTSDFVREMEAAMLDNGLEIGVICREELLRVQNTGPVRLYTREEIEAYERGMNGKGNGEQGEVMESNKETMRKLYGDCVYQI